MKIGIVAGEKSGDYLGSELIKAIKQHYPDAEFVGLCGPLMIEQGAQTLAEMEKISIMGLDGLLSSLGEILAIRKRLYEYFIQSPPDVFIGIDVPDFNLTLEKKLKAKGIPTVHYVSPTVWAWRSSRINKIRKAIDLMVVLFPFEKDFYQQHNVPVCYVGHPLANEIAQTERDDDFRQQLLLADSLDVNKNSVLISLMPGSRMSEVSRLAPVMIDAAKKIKSIHPQVHFVLPAANELIKSYINDHFEFDDQTLTMVDGQSRRVLSACDFAVLASGTAALEAALFAKPMIVLYKASWLTALIVRMTRSVDHFSMPNHLTRQAVVPELLQQHANVDNVVSHVNRLIEQSDYAQSMRSELESICPTLQAKTGELASQAILQLITKNKTT